MSEAARARVFVVDDDAAIRDSLVWLFRSRGLLALSFSSGEAFLDTWRPDLDGCIVADIRMEGIGGLELFDRLKQQGSRLPVVFLTGHGDVPMAVSALKRGARDFIEKPFNDNDLVDIVIAVLDEQAVLRAAEQQSLERDHRLDRLTARERQVLDLLLEGRLNKQIADELGVSMRTVEVHRARVFEKMGVRNAVELASQLAPRRP
ncbi:response regulator transcription factor [Blastochloris viridis]|uniref:Response regulator n=1 Tax=Blastochloris viridis TaxID=1079 RepID=A0A0H5BDP9_BLAVI|nr:response regulator [Blastochloris viridis]ALK08283.1 Transcriptional regulatory protein TdiR [Blastochloris viridis]BAR98451.1 response regulator [Blastochloris viridis]CUU44205.1 Transcriptional regulatory protein fixJ [Blastochloris viridis]